MNMEELERLAALAVGEGSQHATSRDQSGRVTLYNPPPLERDIRREIYRFVHRRNEWVDRAEIAQALNVKKTKWLHDHIERLVTEGYIVRAETVQPNGMRHFWYAVAR